MKRAVFVGTIFALLSVMSAAAVGLTQSDEVTIASLGVPPVKSIQKRDKAIALVAPDPDGGKRWILRIDRKNRCEIGQFVRFRKSRVRLASPARPYCDAQMPGLAQGPLGVPGKSTTVYVFGLMPKKATSVTFTGPDFERKVSPDPTHQAVLLIARAPAGSNMNAFLRDFESLIAFEDGSELRGGKNGTAPIEGTNACEHLNQRQPPTPDVKNCLPGT